MEKKNSKNYDNGEIRTHDPRREPEPKSGALDRSATLPLKFFVASFGKMLV